MAGQQVKPEGSNVTLFYDTNKFVSPGHYIRTSTGRTYVVRSMKRVKDGPNGRRLSLSCIVVSPNEPETHPSPVIHNLWWYRRAAAE